MSKDELMIRSYVSYVAKKGHRQNRKRAYSTDKQHKCTRRQRAAARDPTWTRDVMAFRLRRELRITSSRQISNLTRGNKGNASEYDIKHVNMHNYLSDTTKTDTQLTPMSVI